MLRQLDTSVNRFTQIAGIEFPHNRGLRESDLGQIKWPVRFKLAKPCSLRRKRSMPKFAIGDVVDKDKTHSGTVIAVFMTVEGEQRYAVDMEGYGALQFIMECNLVPHETPQ